jgi:cytochrome c-type biogenesis protein CcmH
VKQWLGWVAIAWLLVIFGVAVVGFGRSNSRPSIDDRTISVASGLRCLVCQGESVAESPSGFAKSVRALIRHELQHGRSPAWIRAFLVSKYTDSILLAPPTSGLGSIAWLAPPLLLLGGVGLLATLVYDWRRRATSAEQRTRRSSYVDRVRAELAADGE